MVFSLPFIANYALNRYDENRQAKANKNGVILGNQLDLANQKEMFDYRIDRAMGNGLTAWEAFLGPAGGGGGGTTGSGAQLGNGGSQAVQQSRMLNQQLIENQKDRQNQVNLAQIQGQTARDVAKINQDSTLGASEISAEASRYAADLKNAIESGKLKLDQRNFEEVIIPQAAAQLDITKKELEKKINEVATSTPEWQTMMKKLSMGAENLYIEYVIQLTGIDPTKPETVKNASETARKRFTSLLAAFSSKAFSEAAGLSEFLGEHAGARDILEGAANTVDEGVQALGNGRTNPTQRKYGRAM